MDKSQAIDKFWNGFALPAYDSSSVPDGAVFPYITYDVETDSLDAALNMAASLWYYGGSWAEISQKAEEIAKTIQTAKAPIKIEGGYLYITKGNPFAQRMSDPEDDMVRRIVINIQAEFLTAW